MTHPLLDRRNRVKETIARGDATLGIFLLTGSAIVTEACTTLPVDWLLVDAEASPVSNDGILSMIQATTGTRVTPIVRVAQPDQHAIEHVLDLGAHGVLVPKVSSAGTAEAVVQAACYPPVGRRGVNPVRASGYFADVPGYLDEANARTLCLVQIETREGLEHADEIAAVPGIDGLFLGPGDMAMELGQPGDVTGPAMDDAAARVLRAAQGSGKFAGIFAYSRELAQRYVRDGFQFVAVSNDVKLLRGALAEELDRVREAGTVAGALGGLDAAGALDGARERSA